MIPMEKTISVTPPATEVNGATTHLASQESHPRGKLPPDLQQQVDTLNKRRLALIDKEFDGGGLNPEEAQELERLQDQVFGILDAYWPLPFDKLTEIRECMKREGLLPDANPSAPSPQP
jgi:hypothetical protein